MKKILVLLILSAQIALGQTMSFSEGESFKTLIEFVGITDSLLRVEVSCRVNDVLLRKFTTANGSIIKISSGLYSFSFTDQMTIGRSGKGSWQIEIQTSNYGVRKSKIFPLEIFKATTIRSTETGVSTNAYNLMMRLDFTPTTPTFDVIASGIIIVDDASISSALGLKQDISTLPASVRSTTLTGLSTASSATVTSSDNVLAAIGKLQAQVSDLIANRLRKVRFGTYAAITGLPANEEVFVIVLVDETNGDKKTYYMWDGYNSTLQWIPTVDAN